MKFTLTIVISVVENLNVKEFKEGLNHEN